MTKQNKNQQKINQLSTDATLFQPITDEQAEMVKGGVVFGHWLCGKTGYLKSNSNYC